ncbi:MAG: nucleotidyltransferase domain-containing protein [candidate division KSB1 bacterium]|nr:nucleotidyltransferase domain-containing protein [candidate division KSB1 bacterium]
MLNSSVLKSWCQKNQIDLCILFGSSVAGRVHARSDVDIALYAKKKDLLNHKLRLIGELEDIIEKTVDLMVLHPDMSPLLRHEIMTKGISLYISDRDIYIEQKIYAIKLYEDVPFLKKWQDLSLSVKLKKLKDATSGY